jgi:phage shock protein A
MLTSMFTIFRGWVTEDEQRLVDENALAIVTQQIHDAKAALTASKRALALTIVQDKADGGRHAAVRADIADLETRAVAALKAEREDLATQAADAITALETERLAIEEHRRASAKEINRLQAAIRDSVFRLANIERARRIAIASEAVQRLKSRAKPSRSALVEAEATLQRLRERQVEEANVEEELDIIDAEASPHTTAARLEAEGFGPRTKLTAGDVLERLRLKAKEDASHPAALPALPATESA